MMDNGRMVKEKEKELNIILMDQIIMVIGKIIRKKEEELSNT